jgi:hypothetical protein
MKLRNLLIASLGLAMAAGAAGAASAATPWQAHHPHRVEVNHRLSNLNHGIRYDLRHGRISPVEAHRMYARLRMIRHQERVLALRDGGHLNRRELARLNHEEAGVRRHLAG